MDWSMFFEFGSVLLILIALEGLLAADNALVLAIMVKHLPEAERKKALFYGLVGAMVFRFLSLFAISFLVNIWQVQAIGALYLLFIATNHIVRKLWVKGKEHNKENGEKKGSSFWVTVLKVELADIAFAIDSILAALALAVSLPKTSMPTIGGMDGGHFIVVFLGGIIGVVIMRFAATMFVKLLESRPGLEIAAFFIVGWVGVKLAVHTLAHEALGVISHDFAESFGWKITFYAVLILIAVCGWFLSGKKQPSENREKMSA